MVAKIDLGILEVKDKERDIAFRAHASHGQSVAQRDGKSVTKRATICND